MSIASEVERTRYYLRDIRGRLGKFSATFHVDVQDITAPLIEEWLADTEQTGRSRFNTLRLIRTFLKWAQKRGHLPAGALVTDKLEIAKPVDGVAIEIFTPDELRRFLADLAWITKFHPLRAGTPHDPGGLGEALENPLSCRNPGAYKETAAEDFMINQDTLGAGIAGNGAAFHTTCWSVVLAASESGSEAALPALEQLCHSYWRPLYAYLRRVDRARSEHDAQDCIQGFFADMLQRAAFTRVDRSKGKFRSFLLASLNNFLLNERDYRRAAKRGGRIEFISWEGADLHLSYPDPASESLSAEEAYVKTWARAVLNQVQDRLEREQTNTGKAAQFELLRKFLTGDKGALTYADASRQLGLGESATKMAVLRLRRRFGEMLREAVAHTVSRSDEVDEEIRVLFAAVTSGD